MGQDWWVASATRPTVTVAELSSWCTSCLGAPIREVVFERGYSSAVFGVALTDDRMVVIKVRPWRDRLMSCWQVHQELFDAGFPCPEPLRPTERLSGLAVSFENFVAGGGKFPRGREAATALARVLADLVRVTPAPDCVGPLAPDLGFLRWADAVDGRWPPASDISDDLNAVREPTWIEDYAARLRVKLIGVHLPNVIGHGDWWSENIRWVAGELLAVDDWDSLVVLPEAAIADVAASLFADGASTIDETDTFLDSYVATSGHDWTEVEVQIAWAAGLWARLFDARKDTTWGSSTSVDRLEAEVEERALRAGVETGRSVL